MEECCWCIDDQFMGLLNEVLNVVVWIVYFYYYFVVGWMDDLQYMMVQDIVSWYCQWYVFNNVILVVVGDVDVQCVLVLVKKYFGKILFYFVFQGKLQNEFEQLGLCCVIVKVLVENFYVVMVWKVFVLCNVEVDQEVYVFDVFFVVLDGYDNVCLMVNLICIVSQVIVVGVSYSGVVCGLVLFMLEGSLVNGVFIEQLEGLLCVEVQCIVSEGVFEQELQCVKM